MDVEAPPAARPASPPRPAAPEGPYDAKAAARAFKDMLASKGVASKTKYGEMANLHGDDAAFLRLRSPGERKQAFAEYQTQRAKWEREASRKRGREARSGFLRLLAETPEITARLRWAEADEILAATCDERYTAVGNSRERAELFADFVGELAKKERAEAEARRRDALDGFRACLADHAKRHPAASHEDDGAALLVSVFGRTPFAEVADALRDEPRFEALGAMEDRRREYAAFVADCRESVRRRDDALRDAFFDAALDAMRAGLLPPSTPFRDLDETLAQFAEGGLMAVQAMVGGQLGAAAERDEGEVDEGAAKPRSRREVVAGVRKAMADAASRLGLPEVLGAVYDDARNAFDRESRADKRRLRAMSAGFDFAEGATLEAWLAHLRDAEARGGGDRDRDRDDRRARSRSEDEWTLEAALRLRRPNVAVVFEDLRDRARSDGAEDERRRLRREDRFRDLLRDYVYRREHLADPFEDLERDLARHSAFDAVAPERRRAIYDDHAAKLKARLDAPPRRAPDPVAVRENDRWQPEVYHGPEPPPRKYSRVGP